MTREREQLLNQRLENAFVYQPQLRILKNLLLGIGGTHLVAPAGLDTDIDRIIVDGDVMSERVELKTMQVSNCHRNVARLWITKRFRIVGIGVGYALSDDGLWRQHTWGVKAKGIIETTTKRTKYFGFVLKGAAANAFAKDQYR